MLVAMTVQRAMGPELPSSGHPLQSSERLFVGTLEVSPPLALGFYVKLNILHLLATGLIA